MFPSFLCLNQKLFLQLWWAGQDTITPQWGLGYEEGELRRVTEDLNDSDRIVLQDVPHLCFTEYFCSNSGSSVTCARCL